MSVETHTTVEQLAQQVADRPGPGRRNLDARLVGFHLGERLVLGHLLPGHGGMMDRVDAMLFTFPAAHLVLLAGRL